MEKPPHTSVTMSSCAWDELPEVVLATIFRYLGTLDKLAVIRTCESWKHAVYRPEVWRGFRFSEEETKIRFLGDGCSRSDLKSYEEFMAELLKCVKRFSKHFVCVEMELLDSISFEILGFIAENCQHLSSFVLFYKGRGLSDSPNRNGFVRDTFHSLLKNNTKLCHIKIEDINYMVEHKNECVPIGFSHARYLTELWVINSFKSCSLSNLMYLVNLSELALNPNQLNFSLLKHLASHSLRNLYIVSNSKTKEFYHEALSDHHWQEIRKCGPDLRVHCLLAVSDEWSEKDVFLKPSMPVASLVFKKTVWLRSFSQMASIVCNYAETLENFADFSFVESTYRHPTHNDYRIDRFVVDICRQCQKLSTLVVKEALSSATLLLLAHEKRDFCDLVVRDHMIIYENEIPDVTVHEPAIQRLIFQNHHKEFLSGAMTSLLGKTWNPLPKETYYNFIQRKYSNLLYNTDKYHEKR